MLKPTSPISIVRNVDMNFVRVMVENSKNLAAFVSTETGLGVPCEFELSATNNVILKPAYSLNISNYLVKLRFSNGENNLSLLLKLMIFCK